MRHGLHVLFITWTLQASKSNKKTAKTYERPGLSEEEIGEIREAFNLFDTDGSGNRRIKEDDTSPQTRSIFLFNF